MNSQDPNIKPNFDFILAQPEPPRSKSGGRKTIMIGAAVVLVGILTIAAVFSAIIGKAGQPVVTNNDTTAVATAFIGYLAATDDANLAKASGLVSPPSGTSTGFVKASLVRMQKTVDFKTCQKQAASNPNNDNNKLQVTYNCTSTAKAKLVMTVNVQKTSSSTLVTAYKVSNA